MKTKGRCVAGESRTKKERKWTGLTRKGGERESCIISGFGDQKKGLLLGRAKAKVLAGIRATKRRGRGFEGGK